jgi:phospholipid N-methyltransferase
MKSFFSEALKSIKTTGSIKPSSKYLVKDCLKGLQLEKAQTIIEFGPGNGCITEEIVNNIPRSTHLYSFEINPVFFNYCNGKFTSFENVQILNKSALELDIVLKEMSIEKVDYIISSLPFTLLKESEKISLLNMIQLNLKKNGVFVQYQYSLGSYKELKNFFSRVEVDLTLRNMPPAFIYKCYI